jgi:hypothetical protein
MRLDFVYYLTAFHVRHIQVLHLSYLGSLQSSGPTVSVYETLSDLATICPYNLPTSLLQFPIGKKSPEYMQENKDSGRIGIGMAGFRRIHL